MSLPPGQHPTLEILLAHANGVTHPTVVQHLETCLDCRRKVAQLSGTSPDVSRIPETESVITHVPIPPELANHSQYEDVRILGQGGMGVVYLAKNRMMDRLEVLKVVNRKLLSKSGAAERFLREIRSAAKLRHPNVVTAYSTLEAGELLVFAMEYVPGDDLSKIIKSKGPLPIQNACFYISQVALGLQHAHEKGMVHRDIKPSNLILTREGKKLIVKILDFGLAKANQEDDNDPQLTGEGRMLGTPDYIAPEQILDAASADIRSDIYSLGCTLYHLLAGETPFHGASLYALLHAHQQTTPTPLSRFRADIPAELAAVVNKMMAKSPADRYQEPGQIARALAPFIKLGSKSEPTVGGSGPMEVIPPPRIEPLPNEVVAPPPPKSNGGFQNLIPSGSSTALTPPSSKRISQSSTKRKSTRPVPKKNPYFVPVIAASAILFIIIVAAALGVFSGGSNKDPNSPKTKEVSRGEVNPSTVKVADAGKSQSSPFVPLFAGSIDANIWDLTDPTANGWSAVNGVLVGKVEGANRFFNSLSTRRNDYGDFILRVTLPRDRNQNSRKIIFREVVDSGNSSHYAVNTGGKEIDGDEVPAGSIYKFIDKTGQGGGKNVKPQVAALVQADDSNTERVIEIRAIGVTITTFVNGVQVATWTDTDKPLRQGRFRLRTLAVTGSALYQKIEVQELGVSAPVASAVALLPDALPIPPNILQSEFVPIFNGKNLAGWTTFPTQQADWKVENGEIVGRGLSVSRLYTERSDFRNFHVRARMKISNRGNGGVYVRSEYGSSRNDGRIGCYLVQIDANGTADNKTGSIFVLDRIPVSVSRSPVAADTWFTMEVIMVSNNIQVYVNGKEVSAHTDPGNLYRQGRIALEMGIPGSEIRCQYMDVRAIPDGQIPLIR
jgi:serine/threonine protein kinase